MISRWLLLNSLSGKKSAFLFSFLTLLFLLFTPMLSAHAAAGDLDPTFGGGGIAQYPGTGFYAASSIAVQTDGKIIAGGTFQTSVFQSIRRFALVRYLPNGLIDTSFGVNGRTVTSFDEYPAYYVALYDIAILPDGKIVAVGSGSVNISGTPFNVGKLFVVRYNSDGSIDTTFSNSGKYDLTIGLHSSARAIAVQPDGKFVVAGYGGGSVGGPRPAGPDMNPDAIKFVLLRFSGNGLDSSFGTDGKVFTEIQGGNAYAYSIALQPDGKIIVGGSVFIGSFHGLSLARYDTNGSLDLSFGNNGFVFVGESDLNRQFSEVLVQPDGKIVAIGSVGSTNNTDFAVMRFDSNGAPDSLFGTNGKVITDVSGVFDWAEAGALQPDGKIIVAGYSYNSNTNSNINPALVRYNSNGTLDATFGNGGIVSIPAGGYSLFDVLLLSDGKILSVNGLRVIRYLGDAPLAVRPTDFDFDGDGWADFAVTRSEGANFNWYAIKNPSNSLILDAEWGTITDRIVPADYDGDGKTDVAVYRPSDGNWYVLKSSNNTILNIQFGQNGDVPMPSDFDGDGRADFAVFRGGTWFILNSSNNSFRAVQFGISGDKPLRGDYDGDGRADTAVFRSGTWYAQTSSAGFFAANFGLADDVPVPADYDGDGKTDLAVFRSSNGTWYLQNSTDGFKSVRFGIASDKPVPADYDADGKTNLAVFRSGIWYIQNAAGDLRAVNFGYADDKPIPTAFQP